MARELQSDPTLGFTGRGEAGQRVIEQIVALIEQRCALTVQRLGASVL
jgi:serine/threonine-protein kinase HipA